MKRRVPNLAKDTQRVRCAIEQMCTRMQRQHRYVTGDDLRKAAKLVLATIMVVWRTKDLTKKAAGARELIHNIDMLKFDLQVGKEINAFGSWKEFEAVIRLVEQLGEQSGGWLKSIESDGQNVQPQQSAGQRASTLSSRPALGATP